MTDMKISYSRMMFEKLGKDCDKVFIEAFLKDVAEGFEKDEDGDLYAFLAMKLHEKVESVMIAFMILADGDGRLIQVDHEKIFEEAGLKRLPYKAGKHDG